MFNIPSFFGFRAGGEPPPPPPPLLDLFPGAAAAYSLRLLNTTYLGDAIQVRRTDLSVMNIGFDINGELDTAALLAFTGTGPTDNGFITEWYDQSGNARNATQSLALNQPQIVSSGSVILDNGKPAIENTSTTGLKTSSVNLTTATDLSIFTVYNVNSTSPGFIIEQSTDFNTNVGGFIIDNTNTTINIVQRTVSPTYCGVEHTISSLNQQIISSYLKRNVTRPNFSDVYFNNQLLTQTGIVPLTSNSVSFRNDILSLFSRNASTSGLIGNYQEFILYANDQVLNNTGINTNINDFYSIF